MNVKIIVKKEVLEMGEFHLLGLKIPGSANILIADYSMTQNFK